MDTMRNPGWIDDLVFSCHSDWEGLYIISRYRKWKIPDSYRYIEFYSEWYDVMFNENANIWLTGCRTGGDNGKRKVPSIAQDIANKTSVNVWAYLCKSSQKYVDGGYRQVPDVGGYKKFVKE